eukprot:3986537-Amphidinium_carterae.2
MVLSLEVSASHERASGSYSAVLEDSMLRLDEPALQDLKFDGQSRKGISLLHDCGLVSSRGVSRGDQFRQHKNQENFNDV